MSNHLEDLTAEWLEFNGYFVRKSVLVGKRSNGGFDGELDVVGFNPATKHLVHIECSLDADPWHKRETRFTRKFDRGREHVPALFPSLVFVAAPDQVALLQFGGGPRTEVGGGRIMWVSDFVADVLAKLSKMPPDKQAVPSTFPLLRTMQLAAQPAKRRKLIGAMIPAVPIPNGGDTLEPT
jgi:hypothetical protein